MSIALPGSEALTRAAVAEAIEAAGRKGTAGERLAAVLDGRFPPEDWRPALAELEADGDVVEWNRRWIAVRYTDWRVGVAQLLDGGDALIRTGERGEVGWFVGRKGLKTARDGDTVLIKPMRGRHAGRDRDLPPATVVKVLRRGFSRVVGTLEISEERRWLIPFDPKLSLDLEVEGGDELLEDQYVVVEADKGDRPRGGPLRGRVLEVLGTAESPGVDVLVILRHLDIPDRFPERVLAEASAFPADPRPEDWRGREDLRSRVTVTIDGESARDFDDAISVERRSGGGFLLGVHIADVSHYVREGTALDLEAYRRGTSVYFPDRAVPMLPEAISNGLCSLRPDVARLTMSGFLEIDAGGRVTSRRFAETVIRSHRRLTYDEVRRLLEEPAPGDPAEYGEVLTLLESARELMQIFHRMRVERGSIDFDLPQGDVVLDTDGVTVGVKPGERSVAHRIIEECMIAANEAVALELDGREADALYRVHEAPDPGDLEELKEILRSLGIALKGDLTDLHPSALQRVLARVEGKPEEPFVSTLVLRAMRRAAYEPLCGGHYALAARHYTHFTSPIRRYPDLLVHRQLKDEVLGRDPGAATRTLLGERLGAIAEQTSATERRAERAERLILQWKLVRLLADRVGEEFSGRITGVQPFGLFVQLVEFYVDGLVPIRSLADDFYVFDQEKHRLAGRDRGHVFRLADEVRVVLTGVDARRRGLELAIAGMPEPPPRPERRGRPGRGRGGRPAGRSTGPSRGRRRERPGRRR